MRRNNGLIIKPFNQTISEYGRASGPYGFILLSRLVNRSFSAKIEKLHAKMKANVPHNIDLQTMGYSPTDSIHEIPRELIEFDTVHSINFVTGVLALRCSKNKWEFVTQIYHCINQLVLVISNIVNYVLKGKRFEKDFIVDVLKKYEKIVIKGLPKAIQFMKSAGKSKDIPHCFNTSTALTILMAEFIGYVIPEHKNIAKEIEILSSESKLLSWFSRHVLKKVAVHPIERVGLLSTLLKIFDMELEKEHKKNLLWPEANVKAKIELLKEKVALGKKIMLIFIKHKGKILKDYSFEIIGQFRDIIDNIYNATKFVDACDTFPEKDRDVAVLDFIKFFEKVKSDVRLQLPKTIHPIMNVVRDVELLQTKAVVLYNLKKYKKALSTFPEEISMQGSQLGAMASKFSTELMEFCVVMALEAKDYNRASKDVIRSFNTRMFELDPNTRKECCLADEEGKFTKYVPEKMPENFRRVYYLREMMEEIFKLSGYCSSCGKEKSKHLIKLKRCSRCKVRIFFSDHFHRESSTVHLNANRFIGKNTRKTARKQIGENSSKEDSPF